MKPWRFSQEEFADWFFSAKTVFLLGGAMALIGILLLTASAPISMDVSLMKEACVRSYTKMACVPIPVWKTAANALLSGLGTFLVVVPSLQALATILRRLDESL